MVSFEDPQEPNVNGISQFPDVPSVNRVFVFVFVFVLQSFMNRSATCMVNGLLKAGKREGSCVLFETAL